MAELPIADFLRERLKEYDSTFEVRKGSAFDDLFFKPLQVILQPFRDEADQLFIGQSMRRILQTENPDAFNEEYVDDLVANVFVYRIQGNRASGVARVYYSTPVYREYPANGFSVTGNNGETYTNPATFLITDGQMSAQVEEGLYYMDIPIQSTNYGKATELPENSLVTVIGDPDYVSVTNKGLISGGADRETNTALIERAKTAITVRDLVTGKGFSATLFENFPNSITEVVAIGFGDDEMMRDIVFNTHIGGKHDGYIKTPSIKTTTKDFTTLLIDETRAAKTTTQLEMIGTSALYLGEPNVDRTVAPPLVMQVKSNKAAFFISSVDLDTNKVNLGERNTISLQIDSVTLEIRVDGLVPTSTSKSEIISAINKAFGRNVAFSYEKYIKIVSPNPGVSSKIIIRPATDSAKDASFLVLGISLSATPYTVTDNPPNEGAGDGPIVFTEHDHYSVDDASGSITRVVGANIAIDAYGTVLENTDLIDAGVLYPGAFTNVEAKDIVTVSGISTAIDGDYRVLEKISDQVIRIDKVFTADTMLDGKFVITRTGIKNGELVFIEFYFNPLSIDIGKFIKHTEYNEIGQPIEVRGIRPGREEYTITDLAFLRVNSIEAVDAITGEPLGIVLQSIGGFGRGGFGQGAYGIGAGSEYRLIVNEPTARFSAFEDSYILISSAYQGYSLRVSYDYVPEIETIHNFCRSEAERVLDGDILVKHFIPAYVSGTITYEADNTDSSIPTNDELTAIVKEFINTREAGTALQLSDIAQYILKNVDPYYRYKGSVKPYTLTATIHNTDGSKTIISSSDALVIPKENPFPKETTRPLSPKIAHWVADEIVLVRL